MRTWKDAVLTHSCKALRQREGKQAMDIATANAQVGSIHKSTLRNKRANANKLNASKKSKMRRQPTQCEKDYEEGQDEQEQHGFEKQK